MTNRSVFERKFESVEGGYHYRKSPTAPAYFVTEDEKNAVIRTFRGQYWRTFAKMLGSMTLVGLSLAILATPLNERAANLVILFGTIGIAGVGVIYVIRQQQIWYALPDQFTEGRDPVSPRRTYIEAQREMATARSWPVHIFCGAIIVGLAVLFFPGEEARSTASFTYAAILVLFTAGWGWTAWLKLTDD